MNPPTATVPRDRNDLEILDPAECLALLSSVPLGRVAVTLGALPVILPVNFVVSADGEIVFRTGEGQKLRAALDGAVVAFEVDGYDPVDRSGWSVLVQDRARVVDNSRAAAYDALDLAPWAGIAPTEYVVLGTERISGRRITR